MTQLHLSNSNLSNSSSSNSSSSNSPKSLIVCILLLLCWLGVSLVVYPTNFYPANQVETATNIEKNALFTNNTVTGQQKSEVNTGEHPSILISASSAASFSTTRQSFIKPTEKQIANNPKLEDVYYQELIIYIACYAVVIAMMLYNFFLFVALREYPYFVYCLYVATLITVHIRFSGIGNAFFWHNQHISEAMILFDASMISIASVVFTWAFLDNKTLLPRHHRLFFGLIMLNLLPIVLYQLTSTAQLAILSIPLLYLITWVTIYSIIICNIRRGDALASLLIITSVILNISDIIRFGMQHGIQHKLLVGWLTEGILTKHIAEITLLMESILWSLALAKKVQSLRKEKLLSEVEHRHAQQAFTQTLLLEQETAKKHIANALHDNFTHAMLILKSSLTKQLGKNHEVANKVDDVLNDMRHLAHQLHPSLLDKLGLAVAIETMIDKFIDDHYLDINCLISTTNLNETQNLLIYRIIQTYLSHILLPQQSPSLNHIHSKDDKDIDNTNINTTDGQATEIQATEAFIIIKPLNKHIELLIKDDSTCNAWQNQSSIAWHTLQQRSQMLSGTLTLDYHENGRCIKILFPCSA